MGAENKISVVEDEGQSGLLALKDYKETAKRFVAFLVQGSCGTHTT